MKIYAVNTFSTLRKCSKRTNQNNSEAKSESNSLTFRGGTADKIATAGTATLGSIALGFIGFCLGGPIGAVIGGALGAGSGAVAQECENDSMNEGDNSSYYDPRYDR